MDACAALAKKLLTKLRSQGKGSAKRIEDMLSNGRPLRLVEAQAKGTRAMNSTKRQSQPARSGTPKVPIAVARKRIGKAEDRRAQRRRCNPSLPDQWQKSMQSCQNRYSTEKAITEMRAVGIWRPLDKCSACASPVRRSWGLGGGRGQHCLYYRCQQRSCRRWHNATTCMDVITGTPKVPLALLWKVVQFYFNGQLKGPCSKSMSQVFGCSFHKGAFMQQLVKQLKEFEAACYLKWRAAAQLKGVVEFDATAIRSLTDKDLHV